MSVYPEFIDRTRVIKGDLDKTYAVLQKLVFWLLRLEPVVQVLPQTP